MIEIRNTADREADVLVYDVIGDGFFGGVSAKQFAENLQQAGPLDNINLRINSPGGDMFAGIAMYNTLIQHPAKVTAYVEGLAASAASVLAMAGDQINIAENAMMMIHNAQTFTVGDQNDHAKTADLLSKASGTIATTYAKRTGRKPETFAKMMDDETWFNAQEAVDHRLADKIMPAKRQAANFDPSVLSNFCRKVPDLSNVLDVPATERRYLEACRARRTRLHRSIFDMGAMTPKEALACDK